jgi:two-component system phosphate regulon sensor histidine kinase PhoR
MRRGSFFYKLFFGNLLVVAVIVALGWAFSYSVLNSHHQEELAENQAQLAGVAQDCFQRLWPIPPGDIDTLCKKLARDSHLRVTFIEPSGAVLGDSLGDPRKMENHNTPDRPEVQAALQGRDGQDVRISATLGVEYRYLARPIRDGDKVAGAVRVALPVRDVAQSQAFLRRTLAWSGVAALLAAALLAGLISWVWYAPLRRVTQAAHEIAAGNLTRRVHIRGSDELARLAQAVNEMRENLARQIAAAATHGGNLQTIVGNLPEGLVAVDGAEKIVLMNRAAIDLLAPGAVDFVGQPLQNVLRLAAIIDVYNAAMLGGQSPARAIEINDAGRRRCLSVQSIRIPGGPPESIHGMIVARDVTEAARAAAMKAEFVANASHELRTPLATIRAAVDSLADIDPSDRQTFTKFIEILERHVQRLQNLCNDLLDLHIVESAKDRLRIEPIEAQSLVVWAQQFFGAPAGEKGLGLEVRIDGPAFAFQSDRKLVELIVQNLLGNAIKFTPTGGRVQCLFSRQGEQVQIQVIDTGCGIRPEDQQRVFERFYQADASRRGDTQVRGTGLGLAIVKHAAERLGAGVSLASEPGQGTTVTITLTDLPAA